MIRFGFSAFLKFLSLNPRPQQTELRKRLAPSSERGYDFHTSLRRHARRYLVDGEPLAEVLASAGKITRLPERLSAIAALERLALWRDQNPDPVLAFAPVVFESPQHLFSVKFEPDFGLVLNGKPSAIHVWNTQKPNLASGAVYAALTLAAQAYETQDGAPEDVTVLSLREPPTLYQLSKAADYSELAARLVERLEKMIEGPTPPPPAPEDRPAP